MFKALGQLFGKKEVPQTSPEIDQQITDSSTKLPNKAWVNPNRRSTTPRISLANIAKFDAEIENMKARKFAIDLTLYQQYLQSGDPIQMTQAREELNVLKQIISDTKTMTAQQVEKKYKRSKIAGRIVSMLGIATSIASGIIDPTPFITQLDKTASTVSKIGNVAGRMDLVVGDAVNVASLSRNLSKKEIKTPTFFKTKFGQITTKAIVPISLLVMTSLTGPAAPVFYALGITTTVLKGGTNYLEHKYKNQLEKIEVDSGKLIDTINEMLAQDGIIFSRTQSPIFNRGRSVKNRINAALNTANSQASIIREFTKGENKQIAHTILTQMIENVKNEESNAAFEKEIEKYKLIEKKSNAELNAMRANRNTRRAKVKKLLEQENLLAAANKVAENKVAANKVAENKVAENKVVANDVSPVANGVSPAANGVSPVANKVAENKVAENKVAANDVSPNIKGGSRRKTRRKTRH